MSVLISHSEAENYLQCRRRWWYEDMRNLSKVDDSRALLRGTIGHAVIEEYLKVVLKEGDSPTEQKQAHDYAVDQARTKFEEVYDPRADDDAHMALEEILFDWYFPHEPLVNYGWQVLATEQKFYFDVDDDLVYPFTVDLLAYDRQGNIVLVDHKFLFDFYTRIATGLQPQIPKYIGALRLMGFEVAYGLYNMVRTRPMAKSHRAPDRLQTLEVKPSAQRVETTFMQQLDVAYQLAEYKQVDAASLDSVMWRTANEHACKSCSFRMLCEAELAGNDREAKLIEKTYFTTRTERYDITNNKD